MDDLGAAVAFSLGLFGDRADHVVGEFDSPALDIADLDAPDLRCGVQDALHVRAEFFALGQYLVEFMPSTARSVVCASMLVAGQIILDLDDRPFRIYDVEIEYGVDVRSRPGSGFR
jgi:hypothetical protein